MDDTEVELCCEDKNVCSIECAPNKKNKDNNIDNKNKCDCGGCC